jgi:superfamily II DNA or RNA helicase
MINAENFYPKFPFIHAYNQLDPYDDDFNDVIVTKKEFASQKLQRIEPKPTKPGILLRHQTYIARFMGPTTGYDELLLFHEPGTGKTCTAVSVIENLKGVYSGAIICTKGEGLSKNFVQELVFTCTNGSYIPENYDMLTDYQKTTRIKRLIGSYYTFKTFETFAKELASLSDNQVKIKYESKIFIVDEVHNLREKDENIKLNIYEQFYRLFHLINKRKILLMSGTPIKDTPDEFASVMNLILPKELEFDTTSFVKTYFLSDGSINSTNKNDMIHKIKGRTSYLNTPTTNVKKVFIGSPNIGNLKHFIVAVDTMGAYQSQIYSAAYLHDKSSKSIYTESRQASLLVFPDGSVGSTGFNKYVKETSHQYYETTKDFNKEMNSLEKVYKHSSKYASVLSVIMANHNSKHFIFCQYVNGSGAIVFANILKQFGYSQSNGTETSKRKRYALCTHQTASNKSIRQIINRFNEPDNIDGEYISIIIGSRVLNEGFTLKNVRNVFIFTPHWNYAETVQAIARSWRLGAHDDMISRGDNVQLDVYQCVSIPSTNTPSIDLEVYEIAEEKDVINRQIERVVKESSFDCPLTIDRNIITGYDGKRECDYQLCNYSCYGKIQDPLDTSTYNLLNDVKKQNVEILTIHLQQELLLVDKYSISDIIQSFPNLDQYQIYDALSYMIDSNFILQDKHGFGKFIQVAGDLVFLSTTPASTGSGIFGEYYSRTNILENGDTFDQILSETYSDNLPEKVVQLFNYPQLSRSLLISLPKSIQREILFACILAKEKHTSTNSVVRDDILQFYFGFYEQRQLKTYGDTWIVRLYSDELGTVCLDPNRNRFVPCDIDKGQVGLKASPIGWYGLYNPLSKDFCIRDVSTTKHTTDLRTLSVGRRCINYDYEILLDIVVNRMMIDPPDQFMKNATKQEILDKLSNVKYFSGKDTGYDSLKRTLYWSTMKKVDLCAEMHKWFRNSNLLETNFDCGTQKKNRAKFK